MRRLPRIAPMSEVCLVIGAVGTRSEIWSFDVLATEGPAPSG